jgi:polysaccharide export outer membrane protein
VKEAELSSIFELFPKPRAAAAESYGTNVERGAMMCVRGFVFVAVLVSASCVAGVACRCASAQTSSPSASPSTASASASATQPWRDGTAADINQRLEQLQRSLPSDAASYRIGTDDLLDISVFDVPDLSRTVRVSAAGDISLPLLGSVPVAGQTPQDLETSLAQELRAHYMRDPQVTVFVKEMESHGVSVFGAVIKPGVYQIRGAKSLIEVLSMAGGLSDEAGDTVTIVPGEENPSAAATGVTGAENDPAPPAAPAMEVNIGDLLGSDESKSNVMVFPGDIVKVSSAGTVYVVGEVHRPGGFALHADANISVLQAISLAEGLTSTAARSEARIIRTDPVSGKRTEIPLNLGKVLSGKQADPELEARDIVFVPNSAARSGLYRGGEALVQITTGMAIYHPF